MFYTDDPVRDFESWDGEQRNIIKGLVNVGDYIE